MVEINTLAKNLKKVFIAQGIDLPDSKITKMAEKNLKEIEELLLFQKYGRPVVKIMPFQFSSFEEIVKMGGFSDGYYRHLEKDEICLKAMLAPASSTDAEELVLFYEGDSQTVPGGSDTYNYFKFKGFEVVEKAHPSLLVCAFSQFTDEFLAEVDIPPYLDFVLPTDEASLLPNKDGDLCFLKIDRNKGKRRLSMSTFNGGWGNCCCFLLRKLQT